MMRALRRQRRQRKGLTYVLGRSEEEYLVSELGEHEPWLTLAAWPEPARFLRALTGAGVSGS